MESNGNNYKNKKYIILIIVFSFVIAGILSIVKLVEFYNDSKDENSSMELSTNNLYGMEVIRT